jgi:hypothetical protein
MASFADLLTQTRREHNVDFIQSALMEAVETLDHYHLCTKLQPFVAHVDDGGNLNVLITQLQNPCVNQVILQTMVRNVANAAKNNERLKQILEAVLGLEA